MIPIDQLIDEVLSANDAPEFYWLEFTRFSATLRTAYQHHIDDTDPVTETPIHYLNRILVDYDPMLTWGDAALAAYIEGGRAESQSLPGAGTSSASWPRSAE